LFRGKKQAIEFTARTKSCNAPTSAIFPATASVFLVYPVLIDCRLVVERMRSAPPGATRLSAMEHTQIEWDA